MVVTPTSNPIIIVLHILALVLFTLASFGIFSVSKTRFNFVAGGWALLSLALVLMDFKVV